MESPRAKVRFMAKVDYNTFRHKVDSLTKDKCLAFKAMSENTEI